MTNYKLQTFATGNLFDDTGWVLNDPEYTKPSLIRAVYENIQLNIESKLPGLFRFSEWLPVNRILENSSAPVTYRSVELAQHLGLNNLFICFSGYWPKKGALMTTCSFKETEAYSVCSRLGSDKKGVMVVASAGNTARAFAKVCSENNIPLLLVVPEDNLDAMWFKAKIKDNVKLICTPSGTDYFDSIELSNKICSSELFFEEGGAKNIARRDGMGTTVLSAACEIGKIPDYYFQAIGSGTGTIAAWEANLRLIEDGRFGTHKMTLIPSQNIPFTPIYDAWSQNSRDLLIKDDNEARMNAHKIMAKVLSNRRPPYSIPGGLFDAMKDSGGTIQAVSNQELCDACDLFEKLEGIDIHPASGVALAGMINYTTANGFDKDSVIMLNITGGGEKMFKADNSLFYMKPDTILDNTLSPDFLACEAEKLFK